MNKIAKAALATLAIGVTALILWLGFQFVGIVIYLWQQERYVSATILPTIILICVSVAVGVTAAARGGLDDEED